MGSQKPGACSWKPNSTPVAESATADFAPLNGHGQKTAPLGEGSPPNPPLFIAQLNSQAPKFYPRLREKTPNAAYGA